MAINVNISSHTSNTGALDKNLHKAVGQNQFTDESSSAPMTHTSGAKNSANGGLSEEDESPKSNPAAHSQAVASYDAQEDNAQRFDKV